MRKLFESNLKMLFLGIQAPVLQREWMRSLQCPGTQTFVKHEALEMGRFKILQGYCLLQPARAVTVRFQLSLGI